MLEPGADPAEALLSGAEAALAARPPAGPRPVLNATGVLLHTNLGRAPLAPAARDAILRAAGYSTAKAATLLHVARRTADGHLPLDHWLHTHTPADEIRAALAQHRGIGPWTIDYTLLRGFARMDGSLHGDAAVRRKLQALLGHDTPPTPRETQAWLAQFAPWRALVAALLWAS